MAQEQGDVPPALEPPCFEVLQFSLSMTSKTGSYVRPSSTHSRVHLRAKSFNYRDPMPVNAGDIWRHGRATSRASWTDLKCREDDDDGIEVLQEGQEVLDSIHG